MCGGDWWRGRGGKSWLAEGDATARLRMSEGGEC